jgi:hypothetical protein
MRRLAFVGLLFAFGACAALAAEWQQFRGPGGQGASAE